MQLRAVLLLVLWAVVLAAFLSEAATEGWSALHLERSLLADAAEGALGPSIFGITMAIGRFSGHVLAHRFHDVSLICGAVCTASLGLAAVSLAPNLALAYAGLAMAGLGISIVVPMTLALVGRSVSNAARVTAISRAAAMGYAAFFLGPPAMGFVAQYFGLRASFLMISLFLGLVAVFILPLLRRQVARAAI